MLRISKLADYATTIMAFLAQQADKRYSAREVSKGTDIHRLPTVSKVLKLLLAANLVKSTQGVNGGYQIASLPAEISLFDVVCAIDGAPALTQCCNEPNSCQRTDACSASHRWREINKRILVMLKETTLDKIYP